MSETKECKPVTISIDFNLPNNNVELKKAETNIKLFRKELELLKMNKTINDQTHTRLYNEIINTLDWVGRMSTPIFDLRDDLYYAYEKAYAKAPKLGYELFDQHYSRLHNPYSKLKNRCFNLLDELDQAYFNKFKKTPPNWEI